MAQWNTIARINLEAVRDNIETIRRRLSPGTPICAAVKADAYGHGVSSVLPALQAARVERLAVANLNEALQLRTFGWTRPIMCFEPILAVANLTERRDRAYESVAADISVTIASSMELNALAEAAGRLHRRARAEIKIDSGMGRMGLLPEQAEPLIAEAAAHRQVVIDGVYTHFATADEPRDDFTHTQLERFLSLCRRLREQKVAVHSIHAANSAAIFRMPATHLDRVRPGLAVYGYWAGPEEDRPELRPAMRVVARLTAIRRIPAGHTIGYGCTFKTRRDSVIGVVPCGYADGYARLHGNDALMILAEGKGRSHKTPVPVVGRISMDQLSVDLTDAGPVAVGDEIIIIDDDPQAPNCVEKIAARLNTIPYEITTLIGSRVQRKS